MKSKLIKLITGIFVITILILLYLSSLYNYLLFHTIAEMFSICIAFTVFVLTWNSSEYLKNNYLIVVGISYFFIGIIDLFHTMSYKGLQIFKEYDYYANQLWIAARFFESLILLIPFAFFRLKKKIDVYYVFSISTIVTTISLLSILVWKIFPICFIEGKGLTPFKKYSEYLICAILFAAIVLLIKNRDKFENRVYIYLLSSIVFTILSELAFTVYTNNYGLFNLLGHYFKIFSFYFMYKSIIVKGIQQPYELIFREMKLTEQKLNEQNSILKNLAEIDGLTGLFNHKHIYERLEEEARKWKENNRSFSVILIDIDHFKIINDTKGHVAGDIILKEIAGILKVNISQSDFVGRYGGEEFLIMLSEANRDRAFEVAEKIRKTIEAKSFTDNIHLTISIGIESYRGGTISSLIENADKKLYVSKNRGRNRTTI